MEDNLTKISITQKELNAVHYSTLGYFFTIFGFLFGFIGGAMLKDIIEHPPIDFDFYRIGLFMLLFGILIILLGLYVILKMPYVTCPKCGKRQPIVLTSFECKNCRHRLIFYAKAES
jgi:DNA-directed RNA polymerase subunit RPC12/RpoP